MAGSNQWYMHDRNRCETELAGMQRLGFIPRFSSGDQPGGDLYAYRERPGQGIDALVQYDPQHPRVAPRFFLPAADLPRHVDGAIDLQELGIRWDPARTAAEVMLQIVQHGPAPRHEGDFQGERLRLANLTERYKNGENLGLGGREDVLRALEEQMVKESNAGIVLLGHPGCGKTSIAMEFVRKAAQGRALPFLSRIPFYNLPLEDLVAAGTRQGDMERELQALLEVPGIIGLVVDEIHRLAWPEYELLAQALKPPMADGKVRILGCTTYDEWRRMKDKALSRRLTPLDVPAPTLQEAFVMVKARARKLETHYGLFFPDETLRASIVLGATIVSELALPASAVEILDRAAAAQSVADHYAQQGEES